MQINQLTSTVTRLFAPDQLRSELPLLFAPVGDQLREAFRLRHFDVDMSGERPLWRCALGSAKVGKRPLQLEHAGGNANELSVAVRGPSEDAIDALHEVWSKLGALAAGLEMEEDLRDSSVMEVPGATTFMTTAIVTTDTPLEELVPLLGDAHRRLRDSLGSALMPEPMARLELGVRLQVGALQVNRPFRIERRFSAKNEDCVYFTVSPLQSNKHIELIDSLLSGQA